MIQTNTTIEESLKRGWLEVAREVVKTSPDTYTVTELETVLIGVEKYDAELAERIKLMIEIKKPNRKK